LCSPPITTSPDVMLDVVTVGVVVAAPALTPDAMTETTLLAAGMTSHSAHVLAVVAVSKVTVMTLLLSSVRLQAPALLAGVGLQGAVDQAGERRDERAVGRIFQEHQRVVVAQRGQVAIAREQCRAQACALGQRSESRAGALPGEMKRDRRLQFQAHVHAATCGQTVNLSNSASSPARMYSSVRSWPPRRRSS